jgi:tRNA A-37 threonylcarbamoyl transferase component Bud32
MTADCPLSRAFDGMIGHSGSALPESTTSDEPIFTLEDGRYAVLEPLGEGGTATVHRCVDRDLGVERAIKLRRVREQDLDTSMVQRLADEARVMARLEHPHILPVFDVGFDHGWQYVVMELAHGSLSDRLKAEGAFSGQRAVDMMIDILAALHTAHEHGIVHRDIKPHNVLFSADGQVLLADWGIALLGDRDQTLTRTGMAMGSVSFMAPEQRLDAHDVGPTADVYAAGAMLYNLITCASPVDLFTAQDTSPRWVGIPDPLVSVLRRACAYDADVRYPSAEAFAAALREVRDAMPTIALTSNHDPDREPHGTLAVPPTRTVGVIATGEGALRVRPWIAPVGLALLGLSAGTLVAAIGWWALQPAPVPITTAIAQPAVATTVEPAAPVPEPVAVTARPEAGSSTSGATPSAPMPVIDRGSTPTPSTPGAGASTPADPDPDTRPAPDVGSVAVLPIHGPWRGSVEGSVARLRLDGPTDALRGTLTLNGVDGEDSAPVTGRFDAQAGQLKLRVDGSGPAAGTLSGRLDGDRIKGTIDRAATGELINVNLKRQTKP